VQSHLACDRPLHSLQRYSVNHQRTLCSMTLQWIAWGPEYSLLISGFLITALLLQSGVNLAPSALSRLLYPSGISYSATALTLISPYCPDWHQRKDSLIATTSSARWLFFQNYSRSSLMWSLGTPVGRYDRRAVLSGVAIHTLRLPGRRWCIGTRLRAAVFPVAVLAISPPLRTIFRVAA